jgi:FdhD protein
VPQRVGDAGDERPFRPDHDEVGVECHRKAQEAVRVVRANRVTPPESRDAGVAGGRVELGEVLALPEPPREGVLPRTGTDDHHLHAGEDTCLMGLPPYSTARVRVVRFPGEETDDVVAVEEPLEIRIGGTPVAVTMRTPGHDEELALGFALSEGLRPAGARLPDDLAANTVELDAPGFDPARLARSFYTTSSCGVCGKGALEAIAVEAPPVESDLRVSAALLATLPERLREAQPAFEATGGLHATGLFDATGSLLCLREDVGRHNAMDKVIGWAFGRDLLPLAESILCVSGRLSFELVQKAAVSGCPLVVAVGAPSSLAVALAADRRLTICGFVRGGRVNVYSEPWRVER